MKPKNEKRQYGRGCCAVDWWSWLLHRRLVLVAAAPSTGARASGSKYKTAFFRIVKMKLELPMIVFEVPVSTIMFCLVKKI
ncbi:hypothetical protein Q3G72_020844 [Acer saccharum]|nr:hypothetical protein Q3G72_020844 [Acer saccharum]